MKIIEGGAQAATESLGLFNYQNTINWYSWSRLAFYGVAYVGCVLLQLLQGDFLCLEVWQPINLLTLVAFVAHAIFIEFANSEARARRGVGTLIALDILIALCAMWAINNYTSLFLLLVMFHISAAGFFLGRFSALKLAIFSMAAFNLLFSLHPLYHPEQLKTVWAVTNMAPLLVAGLTAFLGEQVQSAGVDLQAKAREIRVLTDINELIVENIPSGLLVLDEHYKIIRANRGAAKIFSELGLESRSLHEVSLDLELTVQDFATRASTSAFERHEVTYFNYKKEKLVLEVILSSINRGDEPEQVVCLLQNLTEIKNLEFAMQQKEKLAAVGQLAAGIAHEIRNPLASISGSVQLLQGNLKVQTDEDKKLLAIVIKEIDRLNRLITEFLDFVRPEARVEDPININMLAKEVLDMVRVNEKLSKKVEQRTELRAQGVVSGQYDKLKQAVMNIVINGYQAMNDTLRPEIFVASYDEQDKVILVIQDNGMGMTKDNMRRIFEPFHTTKAQGTGLGLAITHKIIETHRARIDIESEVGQGAKFRIVFPTTQTPESDDLYLKKQA